MIWIFTNQFKSLKDNLQPLSNFEINENVTYSLFLTGALGGSFYCLRALYERLGQNFTPVIDEHKTDIDTFNIKVCLIYDLKKVAIINTADNFCLDITHQDQALTLSLYFI